MTIKAIIFDLGGVLLQWSPLALYQKHFPHLSEAEITAFFHEVDFTAWNLEQDKGRTFDDGVAALSARFPQHAALIRAYHDHWFDCIGGPIDGTVRILERFSGNGIKIVGLTNFSSEKFALTRQAFPFFRHFDDVIVSGDVKLIKPDPAIYHLTLEQIGCQAQECVFVDDSLPNIEMARKLGFIAIHFQSPEQLETELGRYR
jgi:2-haloacid dehalogenase